MTTTAKTEAEALPPGQECVRICDVAGTNAALWQCPTCNRQYASESVVTCNHEPPRPAWEDCLDLELALFGHAITHDGRNTR